MSISPAQMILQVASAESFAPRGRSAQSSGPAAVSRTRATGASSAPAPAVSPTPQLSTDMKVDGQHQVYYEFVDDGTGNVLFEIPPEALREIGESLNVPLVGDANVPTIDVKS
ncbi:MAG: hypothetical protein WAO35_20585 [Terriglobia bacterium]